MRLVARKVVGRWLRQTVETAFLQWQGKAAEEKRAAQIMGKVMHRWMRGIMDKVFSSWVHEKNTSQPAAVSITLDMDYEASMGLLDRKAFFEKQLCDDISSALDIEKDRITVLCHQKGGIVSEIVFRNPDAEQLAKRFIDVVGEGRFRTGLGKLIKKATLHGPICNETIRAIVKAKTDDEVRLQQQMKSERDSKEHEQSQVQTLEAALAAKAAEAARLSAEMLKRAHELEAEVAAKTAEARRLNAELHDAGKKIDALQLEVHGIFEEASSQKMTMLESSKHKLILLGNELNGLKALLERERETRRKAEQEAQRLLARNIECEQLKQYAQEKLKKAKHEIALELATKTATIARLKSELDDPEFLRKKLAEVDDAEFELFQKEKKLAQRKGAPPPARPGLAKMHADEWKDLLVRARDLIAMLQKRVRDDVLAVETIKCSSTEESSKSTVGLMFNGNGHVENVMAGGPAYTSRKIFKGDVIVKVDGQFVQGKDLQRKIIGDDVPGSLVTLTLKRGPADLVEVTMKRISTEEVADKRRMFDLFTKLNDRAKKDHDSEASKCVDETLLLWEKMLNADFDHDKRIFDNVRSMQLDCVPLSDELFSVLNSIGRMQGWDDDFPPLDSVYDPIPLVSLHDIGKSESKSPMLLSPNLQQAPLQRHPEGKDIVGYCEFLCTLLEEAVSNDVLSVPCDSISSGFNTKSTVGMMLVGMSIDNMVVGGPAYNCQRLNKGDILLKVDDEEVSLHDFHERLVGCDVPGSLVRLTVLEPEIGEEKEVMLTRMATSAIADNVRMFEIFTALKDRAFHDRDEESMAHIDDLIALWSRMLLNTADTNNSVLGNVLNLQKNSIRWLQDMRFSFRRLRREGYTAQGEKQKDELSDWLLGSFEVTKRRTPQSSASSALQNYVPLDEARGLFQTPGGNSVVASYLTPQSGSRLARGQTLDDSVMVAAVESSDDPSRPVEGRSATSSNSRSHPKFFAF